MVQSKLSWQSGSELFFFVDSFTPLGTPVRCQSIESSLFAKGMAKSKSKPMGGGGMGGGGMGTKTTKEVSVPFNVNAALMKSEKHYDKLLASANKSMNKEDNGTPLNNDDRLASEYMIAARAVSASDLPASVKDWVPIAQLCLSRPPHDAEQSEGTSDPALHAAISCYCRELSHAATIGSPVFNTIARNDIQYSVETMDSFHKFVYETVYGKKKDEPAMTKAEARAILNLEDDNADKVDIKQAYRKLTFALHPDRFVGSDRSLEEQEATNNQFANVKDAYETLSSGVREVNKSWYESLGGKSRTAFFGPVDLLPISDAKALMDANLCESAVIGVSRDLVQTFLVRNQAAMGL